MWVSEYLLCKELNTVSCLFFESPLEQIHSKRELRVVDYHLVDLHEGADEHVAVLTEVILEA